MHRKLWTVLLVLLFIVVSVPTARGMTLLEMLKPPANLNFCGEPVPFELADVTERFEKEMLLIAWDQAQVVLWLKRTTRYFPYIGEQLKQRGMPEDLRFLPIVESALRTDAGSSAGAIGLWQLMPATARNFGLRVDSQIDERRDVALSTRAALDYLQTLYAQFGSWSLAAAAYNMGEDGLATEILEQNNSDYYKLFLPMETQRYVIRILVTKLVAGSPQAYGFQIDPGEYYPPESVDSVWVDCARETPLRIVAEAANTYYKMIRDLNPKLRARDLPVGQHQLFVPPGGADGFQMRFESRWAEYERMRQNSVYIVQSGDSISSIARKFNVPLNAVKLWNRLDLNKPIQPGEKLVIFSSPPAPVTTP